MEPATFDNLSVGDRVRHDANGEGTVIAKGDTIDVQFDHVGRYGRHWSGSYDRNWFRWAQAGLVKLSKG